MSRPAVVTLTPSLSKMTLPSGEKGPAGAGSSGSGSVSGSGSFSGSCPLEAGSGSFSSAGAGVTVPDGSGAGCAGLLLHPANMLRMSRTERSSANPFMIFLFMMFLLVSYASVDICMHGTFVVGRFCQYYTTSRGGLSNHCPILPMVFAVKKAEISQIMHIQTRNTGRAAGAE